MLRFSSARSHERFVVFAGIICLLAAALLVYFAIAQAPKTSEIAVVPDDGVYRIVEAADVDEVLDVSDEDADGQIDFALHAEDGTLGELFRISRIDGDATITSVSTGAAVESVGSNMRFEPVELTEFQVIGDLQMTAADSTEATHFANALADIKLVSPDSSGIVVVGDETNAGRVAQYDEVKSLIADAGLPLSSFTFVAGNHEQRDGSYADDRARFATAFDLENGVYYDRTVGGCHFIVLGNDGFPTSWGHTVLSSDELSWLADRLDADERAGAVSYVFIHQPLGSTTSASYEGDHAYNIDDDAQLAAVLAGHAHVVVFSGHTHYALSTYRANAASPLFVNTAAVAYLRSDAGELEGSQGWFGYVYEGKTVLRGRDFLAHAWIPGAECLFAAA